MANRRDFIKKSTLGTSLITIGGIGFSAKSYASIIGANERINLAVIGIHNQGIAHINSYCSMKKDKNVWLTTLCDTDEQFFADRWQKQFRKKQVLNPLQPGICVKFLIIKTYMQYQWPYPDHWHALATIWALSVWETCLY